MKKHLQRYYTLEFFGLFCIGVLFSSLVFVSGVDYSIYSYRGNNATIDGIIDAQEEIGTGKPVKITMIHDPWDLYGKPRERCRNRLKS